jgi:D-alanyl-D-alanine carboxypeptidase/D-alanyl-D-alanine-endopeptidase (penicillin-binding protein 4)
MKGREKGKGALLLFTFYLAAGCSRTAPVTTPARSDPVAQLAADITIATRAPGVARGAWGVSVYSLDRGEPLFALNDTTLLVPASTAKLIALAAAAESVGWNYRYETVLRATGPVVDGVVQGDLIAVGSGDPSIGGRGGTELAAFVNVLKAAGIRRVEGRVIGDDNALEEPRPQLGWAWDDLGYTTGAIFGALNAAENRLELTVSPGPAAGTSASVLTPPTAYRPIDNRVATSPPGSQPLIWPEQRPGLPFLTIAGSIPAGAAPARLQVSAGNPTFWFAASLRHAMVAAGVEVTGEAFDIDDLVPVFDPASASTLYVHMSPPLSELARPMLKDSLNLYAEAALRLNTPGGTFPTNDAALEGLRKTLAGWDIPADGWQVVDGSGLSRRNAVAAGTLIAVLRRMWDPTGASPWMVSLPVAGVDGTLAGRMADTAAARNVRAKTGTMSNIRALAGYAQTRDGEPLAFAILVNNFEGPGAAAIEAIDRIAVALASFSRK